MIDNSPVYIKLEEVKGEKTGSLYTGEFTIKKFLTQKERIDATRLAESLARGIERSPADLEYVTMIAHLAFHVISAPAWWGDKGLDLYDREPAWALSDKLIEVQNPKESQAPA